VPFPSLAGGESGAGFGFSLSLSLSFSGFIGPGVGPSGFVGPGAGAGAGAGGLSGLGLVDCRSGFVMGRAGGCSGFLGGRGWGGASSARWLTRKRGQNESMCEIRVAARDQGVLPSYSSGWWTLRISTPLDRG
jgi:hypothetical protein